MSYYCGRLNDALHCETLKSMYHRCEIVKNNTSANWQNRKVEILSSLTTTAIVAAVAFALASQVSAVVLGGLILGFGLSLRHTVKLLTSEPKLTEVKKDEIENEDIVLKKQVVAGVKKVVEAAEVVTNLEAKVLEQPIVAKTEVDAVEETIVAKTEVDAVEETIVAKNEAEAIVAKTEVDAVEETIVAKNESDVVETIVAKNEAEVVETIVAKNEAEVVETIVAKNEAEVVETIVAKNESEAIVEKKEATGEEAALLNINISKKDEESTSDLVLVSASDIGKGTNPEASANLIMELTEKK